jgi:HEAT repeat associated with sister chromatid cohesion
MHANKKVTMQLKQEFDALSNHSVDDGQQAKSWITRGHLISVGYVRNVMRLLNIETEVRDIFQALKNVMLCISYLRLATLRAKAMKTIKKVIKINPELLNDSEILKIIQLRLLDVSSSTRETTLDLLWQSLTKLNFDDDARTRQFEQDFLERYLPIIIERAEDGSLAVRKRVVQILSHVLSNNTSDSGVSQGSIIKVLVRKWDDQNE